MKVTIKYIQSKTVGCLGISVCAWWVHIYCTSRGRHIFASYTKPTARQIRRWKKQASVWYHHE